MKKLILLIIILAFSCTPIKPGADVANTRWVSHDNTVVIEMTETECTVTTQFEGIRVVEVYQYTTASDYIYFRQNGKLKKVATYFNNCIEIGETFYYLKK